MSKVTGSCTCGRHSYTIPKPTEMNLCHCRDCQKWAGAFHSAHLLLKTDVIEQYGPEPHRRTIKAESGRDMERAWCDECGSGIWITIVGSDMTNLKAGLFELKDLPNPTMENWLKNLQPWETLAKGTKLQAPDNGF